MGRASAVTWGARGAGGAAGDPQREVPPPPRAPKVKACWPHCEPPPVVKFAAPASAPPMSTAPGLGDRGLDLRRRPRLLLAALPLLQLRARFFFFFFFLPPLASTVGVPRSGLALLASSMTITPLPLVTAPSLGFSAETAGFSVLFSRFSLPFSFLGFRPFSSFLAFSFSRLRSLARLRASSRSLSRRCIHSRSRWLRSSRSCLLQASNCFIQTRRSSSSLSLSLSSSRSRSRSRFL
mmetsp:Transcript_83886/g.245978  ORF Transcript_83886/g.245978 Transcript_83886/m.245978 type:complete len:237 (+) Transcript_83886:75-785(+)